MKFLDDSASFLLEKLKNHVMLTKNLIFDQKSRTYPKNPENSRKFLGTYVETYVEDLCGGPPPLGFPPLLQSMDSDLTKIDSKGSCCLQGATYLTKRQDVPGAYSGGPEQWTIGGPIKG